MSSTVDINKIVQDLEDLRSEYIANGYTTPASVTVRKDTEPGDEPQYTVEHSGVTLGWVAKVGGEWHAFIYEGIAVGTRVDVNSTRKGAIEEIVWAAGRFENARKIAKVHEQRVYFGLIEAAK